MPGPCPYAIAMMRVPSAKWATRAEVYLLLIRARKTIERDPAAAPNLNGLAAIAGVSPHHFHRLFRQTFGETPASLRARLKFENAAALLANSKKEVSEVCLESGFLSVASFCRAFASRFGMTPSQYRLKFAK